jgi:polyvinyl alcohol dehydrogenase (cytochrome)
LNTLPVRASLILLLQLCLTLDIRGADVPDGGALYRKHCASCHESGAARAPNTNALRSLSPERILMTLEGGAMMIMGQRRTDPERRAIAEYLAGKALGHEPPATIPQAAFCKDNPTWNDPLSGPHWTGWGAALRRFPAIVCSFRFPLPKR